MCFLCQVWDSKDRLSSHASVTKRFHATPDVSLPLHRTYPVWIGRQMNRESSAAGGSRRETGRTCFLPVQFRQNCKTFILTGESEQTARCKLVYICKIVHVCTAHTQSVLLWLKVPHCVFRCWLLVPDSSEADIQKNNIFSPLFNAASK